MTGARRGAGLLAAGVTLIAAGAVSTAAGAAPARATPTHVAIVVVGQGQACVPWHSGMTGADVLDAEFDVTWGRQSPYIGFVLQINGHGTLRPDDEHYWSYWRNTGGEWTYSGRGSASTTVTPGTVEGWSYVSESTTASAPPPSNYARICAGQDASGTPTRHPSTRPPAPSIGATHSTPSANRQAPAPTRHHRTPARTSAAATTTAAPTRATATTTGLSTPRTSAPPTTSRAAPPSTTSAAPTSRRAAAGAITTGTPAPRAASEHTASEHAASEHTAALPSWTTALALLVVLAVGATAMVRIRGSRR